MKSTIKIFLTMLCIGLSTNIMSMQTTQKNPIESLTENYTPNSNPYSKAGAVDAWATELVNRLSNNERAALIYHCYTAPINHEANANWGRGITSFASATARVITSKVVDLTRWGIVEKPTQLLSYIASPFTGLGKYIYSSFYKTLPRLDEYLNTNKNAYKNGAQNNSWFFDILRLAKDDFNDPKVTPDLSVDQRNNPTAQIKLVIDKIMPIVIESAKNNGTQALSQTEIENWLVKNWTQPQASQQQWSQQTPPQLIAPTTTTIISQTPATSPFKTNQTPTLVAAGTNPFVTTLQKSPAQPQPIATQQGLVQQQQPALTTDVTTYIKTMPMSNSVTISPALQTWINTLKQLIATKVLNKTDYVKALENTALVRVNTWGNAVLPEAKTTLIRQQFKNAVIDEFNK